MNYYEVLFYIEFIGRNALALMMLLSLSKRFKLMQQMGKCNIEVRSITPASYMIRFFLLLSHCILTLLTILLYYTTDELDDQKFNFYKYCWTLAFQISIFTFQVIVMRKEYRRQVPYMKMHQIYWILDLLLYIALFVAESSTMGQQKLTLPISILAVKVLIVIFSFFGNQNSMRLLEKSFLNQATKFLVDLPSTTARSGMKIISTLNTQHDKSGNNSPKKSIKSSFSIQKEQDNRIKVKVKYQFEINKSGDVDYVLECQDFLKPGNKVILKKNIKEFLQLQKDINSIKNPLNLTNFSYISSQILNENQKNNQQNMIEKDFAAKIEDNLPTIICTDRQMLDDHNQNNDDLKLEDNAFKQILSLQKYLDYITKEFYFEEAFLVKFLGLTRKQYYIEVSQLQGIPHLIQMQEITLFLFSEKAQDCLYQNENEFTQFKQDYPKLKNNLNVSIITRVSLETLGNIKNDGITYYQIILRKSKLNSGVSLPSFSQPLRYTDFYNFYKALQKEIFPIRLPEFPPKSLLNDKETMYQRKQQLLKFLSIIYNENIYFSETLFSFQNCFQDYMIQQAQQINNDLFQYKVQLLGKYLNSSKQFLFRLYSKRKQAQTNKLNSKKKHRFKDIINLHKDLELYYTNLLQYFVQQAYQEFKEKQLNLEADTQNNPQVLEEKNILKEIKKTIKIPNKPKNINDCGHYLQDILDCNIYHKCISFRQFLFRFEYLEEMLNDNVNSSICISNRGYSYDDERNL